MKFQGSAFIFLIAFSLAACSTVPSNSNTPIVLEQHKNLSVIPETKHNTARLIKQIDNCVIEFTGNFETGKATEYWIFKGEQLISAYSNINAELENKQTVFDPQDPSKQQNLAVLKKNFSPAKLQQCN